jgi:rubrerythrin
MEDELTSGLRGFADVWQRVTGTSSGTETQGPQEEEKQLAAFIRDENRDMVFYEALADRSSPHCREQILQLLRDERRHLLDLQTEYFLLTGDSCPVSPPAKHGFPAGLLSALRDSYDNELQRAAAYESGAGQTRRDDLKELCRRHAEEERAHAAILYRLIRQALT